MTPPPLDPIVVLVVDDEMPARQRLVDLLARDPRVGAILQAENGATAVDLILSRRPALVFLDVQMPELDGFGVIAAVGADRMPLTIFVTAYDQHAIRAFEAQALDYLLKPFTDERHESAMARVHARLAERNLHDFGRRMLGLLSAPDPAARRWDRLVVRSSGVTRFIHTADVDWIEGAGVYANLHIAGKQLLYRASLNELAEKLDPERFVRVHRSAIVNLESIVQLNAISHGEFELVLKDGSRPRVSRGYRGQLERRLGQAL